MRRGSFGRSLLLGLSLFTAVFAAGEIGVEAAQAQATSIPVYKGTAGHRIDGIGNPDPTVEEKCVNVRNVVIHFGDGTSGPADRVTGSVITGHHTYRAAGTYLGTADADLTCTAKGVTQDIHVKGTPGGNPLGFIVVVDGGCEGAGTAQVRPAQTSCAFPPKVKAPKQPVPLPVKRYFEAKRNKLQADSAFLCGAGPITLPNAFGTGVANIVFFPYCASVLARIDYYDSIIVDPPDPANAAEIARPRGFVRAPTVSPGCKGNRRCAAIRAAATRVVSTTARVASVTRAMSAGVDRFGGGRQIAPIAVNDVLVLQSAMTKVYAGELAAAHADLSRAGRRLAKILRAAKVKIAITGPEARANAERLARLEGIPEAQLKALEQNGVARAQVRALFTRAIPLARAQSLNGVLTAGDSTRTLRSFYRSLTVAEIAHIESRMYATQVISAKRHAALKRDLKRALPARTAARRRSAMRVFVRDAKKVKGVNGSLLRRAGGARTG